MKKVHCYWTTRLAGGVTRSGELGYAPWRAGGEQTLLSATLLCAVASGWRANTALYHVVARRGEQITRRGKLWQTSAGSAIFHPKNPIFINPNPKFDRELNLWWFYDLNINYTEILWTFHTINNQILPHDLIPKFTEQQQQLHVKFSFRIT